VSGLTDVVPFLLESALVSLGASYTKSQDFVSYVVIDRNIVTGQNSASAKEVARKLLVSLKELPKKAEVVTY
jgi:putative intracellular protease/amidase